VDDGDIYFVGVFGWQAVDSGDGFGAKLMADKQCWEKFDPSKAAGVKNASPTILAFVCNIVYFSSFFGGFMR
jgi:hypothetical protein